MSAKTRDFRITKAGANHTVVDASGARHLVGYGDTITLKEYDPNSSTNDMDAEGNPLLGKFNNLGLVSVNRHNTDTGGDVLIDDGEFEDHEAKDPKGPVKSLQGTESEHSDPAARGAGDDDDDADTTISDEDLGDLIQEVEDSKVGDGTFDAARKRVIAADLFEESTLPDTKSGVLEALKSLKPTE